MVSVGPMQAGFEQTGVILYCSAEYGPSEPRHLLFEAFPWKILREVCCLF